MDGFNSWTGVGTIGKLDLRRLASGVAVLKLRLACKRTWMHEGRKQEKTEWVSVAVWDKRAVALDKILEVGRRIMVTGPLETSSYEKNGERRYSTEVRATTVLLLDGKPQKDEEPEDLVEPETFGGGGGFSSDDEVPF